MFHARHRFCLQKGHGIVWVDLWIGKYFGLAVIAHYKPVIASEAKQTRLSIARYGKPGLLRFARNDSKLSLSETYFTSALYETG